MPPPMPPPPTPPPPASSLALAIPVRLPQQQLTLAPSQQQLALAFLQQQLALAPPEQRLAAQLAVAPPRQNAKDGEYPCCSTLYKYADLVKSEKKELADLLDIPSVGLRLHAMVSAYMQGGMERVSAIFPDWQGASSSKLARRLRP